MKKSIILCICITVLFMTSAVLTAQVPQWEWAKQAGGSGSDVGYGIGVDANGNSYVTGYFYETATFGAFTLTSSGSYDIFVAKFDTDGNWQWAKQAGGSSHDHGFGISVDADGNSYVTGRFMETATFGAFTITSSGAFDVFVAKIDTDGNWQWAKQAGGSGAVHGYGTSVDADGNSYVTGYFQETATFGDFTITSSGSYEAFVAKLDADGNWQWAKQAGGSSADGGSGIIVDADGNSYVIGFFAQTATFGDFTLTSVGSYDVFVAKLDTDGNWQWVKQAGGSSADDGADIIVDADGNSYVTGMFKETATFGAYTITSSGSYDVYVAKLDTAGNWQWAKQAGGSASDNALSISVDANCNSYVTGKFYETATFGDFTLTSSGDYDVFVAKIDTDGNWQWARQAGGGNFDEGRSISVDANGNLYVIGFFAETAIFGDFTITSVGSNDVFVAKIAGPIGDFNLDGYVDAYDLNLFGDHWHLTELDPGWDPLYNLDDTPDVNGNQIIDAYDLNVFGNHWHEGIPPKSDSGKSGKGPNEFAGIVFDLDAETYGNQNLTSIPSQPAGTMIRLDVYCTGVQNLDTYEFEVIYDPTELAYVGATAINLITFENNILTSLGGEALGWMIDSSTPGVLSIAYTLAGTDPAQAPEGEGLIADIVFEALVATHGTLTFGYVLFIDSFGEGDVITNTGTATLPVELAAFTATYLAVNGYTTIYWATASETDVNGFNVYRNTEDVFGTAMRINADLIPGYGTTSEPKEYTFIDDNPVVFETTYYYSLESVDLGGETHVYASISLKPEEGEGGFVNDFKENKLENYPNPFSGSTIIEYAIKGRLKAQPVEIRIYNVAGQLVETIKATNGIAEWNAVNLPTGIYFYQLKTENYNEVNKMLLIK